VHVAGADQRAAHLAREPHDLLVAAILQREPVLLHLEVDVLAPERADQMIDVLAALHQAPVGDPRAQPRGQTAGQRDDAVPVARDLVHVDRRLATLQPLEEARRTELHEIAVAIVAAGQQREMVALEALPGHRHGLVVIDEVDLAADDRLDPGLAGALVQLDRPVHHTVVGEPECRLTEGRRTLDQPRDLRRPVEQRVLGVNVKVGAVGLGHPVD
jgi:hypothetical protein